MSCEYRHTEWPEVVSGYTECACRDCFDVSISSDVRYPELCLLCKPGCDAEGDTECSRDDAYNND